MRACINWPSCQSSWCEQRRAVQQILLAADGVRSLQLARVADGNESRPIRMLSLPRLPASAGYRQSGIDLRRIERIVRAGRREGSVICRITADLRSGGARGDKPVA